MNDLPYKLKLEEQAYQLTKRLNSYFDRQLQNHQRETKSGKLGPFLYRVARLCHRANDRYERRWVDEG